MLLQGYGGGGNGFRLDCQRGNSRRRTFKERKIKRMSSEIRGKRVGENQNCQKIRKEGRQVKITEH